MEEMNCRRALFVVSLIDRKWHLCTRLGNRRHLDKTETETFATYIWSYHCVTDRDMSLMLKVSSSPMEPLFRADI